MEKHAARKRSVDGLNLLREGWLRGAAMVCLSCCVEVVLTTQNWARRGRRRMMKNARCFFRLSQQKGLVVAIILPNEDKAPIEANKYV